MSRDRISIHNTILENLKLSTPDKYLYLNQGSGRILIFYNKNERIRVRDCMKNFNNYYISLSGGTIHVRKQFLEERGKKWLFKPIGDYVEGGSIPFEYYQNLISDDARIQNTTLEICLDSPRLEGILNRLELTKNRTRYLDYEQSKLGYHKDDVFFKKIRRGLENCIYLRYGTRDIPFRETNTCIDSLGNHYPEAYKEALLSTGVNYLRRSSESRKKKISRVYNFILKRIILHISEEFKNKFELISGPEKIFRYPKKFGDLFKTTIEFYVPINILKYIVSSKKTGKSYGMYFLQYLYKNKDIFGKKDGIKTYTILVGMYPLNDENKPIETSNRELGEKWIGHRYVSLPGYIVKPFDYQSQSTGAAGAEAREPATRTASDNYNFVGDIYDGVWPSTIARDDRGRGGARGGAGGFA
jgi:hypothetical protein